MKTGFEVEWCETITTYPDGSMDIDRIPWLKRDFPTYEAAVAFAQDRLPHDCFSSVRITPFEMVLVEPRYRAVHKEYTGDSEHIEQ